MQPFVPKEKLSKQAKRALDRAQRNTWGPISPVTRKVESKKVYSRKKARLERNDSDQAELFIFIAPSEKGKAARNA